MFYIPCVKHHKTGPWVSRTDNFRLKTVETRLSSREHKEAMAAEAPGRKALPEAMTAAQEGRNRSIGAALR